MGKTILVVDDEPGYRDLLALELTSGEVFVLTAANGALAAETLRREKVDLVITDMKMPRLDGLDVVRTVRNLSPDLPVILISGYSLEDRAAAAVREASAFLRKPFEMSELRGAMAALLRTGG